MTRSELAVGVPLSAVAGLVVGAIGTFKHQYGISAVTGQGLPIGLVLALLMVLVFLVALRTAFPVRWYAVAAAVGIVAADALLLLPGTGGGSTVILLNVPGLVWTFGVPFVAAVVVAWPRRRRSAQVDEILEDARAEEDD